MPDTHVVSSPAASVGTSSANLPERASAPVSGTATWDGEEADASELRNDEPAPGTASGGTTLNADSAVDEAHGAIQGEEPGATGAGHAVLTDAAVVTTAGAVISPALRVPLNATAPTPGTGAGVPPAVKADQQAKEGTASDAFHVSQIKRGAPDSRGVLVEHIYALRSEEYAIYGADGIWVEFADAPDKEKEQRKAVLSIGEARADLASLLLGWKPRRRRVYDCKIAMALQLALDDQVTAAQKVIDSARADVLNERAAAGRLQYLASAVASCIVLGLLLVALGLKFPLVSTPIGNILLAGQAGLAGAAFSIVLAIKSRTVALDTDLVGNASDGLLRLAIGMISGGLLLLLLTSKVLPPFGFGGATFGSEAMVWQSIVVLGFIAGFMERMVPDLLDKAGTQPVGAPKTA